MMTMKQLDVPVRQWVPDWLGMICIFFIILPVTMLNGSYTGSMLEVSSTVGTNTEDITMGYYAASAGMAIAYPIVPKVLDALSSKFLLLTDLTYSSCSAGYAPVRRILTWSSSAVSLSAS